MPQMSPMMWLILSIFNFINLFFLMIYLNSMPMIINMKESKELCKMNKYMLKWKWVW